MRRLAGLHISPSEYAQWEAGSRVPRPDNPKVERLYDFFGSRPADELEESPDLASALLALAEELRRSREAREATEARLRGVEGAVALLATQAGVELPELAAPQG
jgi:transcriptional regulator with XRE-family HTH domain